MNQSTKKEGQPDLTVTIMAGGKSSRMGTDKSFVPFRGRPLIEHVLEKVNKLGNETIIITNNPAGYDYLGLPIFGDLYANLGPLGGLHSALHHAANPYILLVACDMPWLSRPLLTYLVSLRTTGDVVVPRWDKYPEPMHAVYRKSCLDSVESNLRTGNLKLISFYGEVSVRFVNRDEIEHFDPEGQSFANVNTPGDLESAQITK
ncbi:MAG TPA: molybdenum cofactor guanylyltransferase [Patescibacteria group bacterium]|nr:molybdenum cofactor guanylyltransferase [Patescibacteria group bacterium]